jgi:hypothetical protein
MHISTRHLRRILHKMKNSRNELSFQIPSLLNYASYLSRSSIGMIKIRCYRFFNFFYIYGLYIHVLFFVWENLIHFENFSFCVEFVLNAELKLWGQHYHNSFCLKLRLMQNVNNFLSIHVSVCLLYHGGRTDIILGVFEDGWKFANENTSIKYM